MVYLVLFSSSGLYDGKLSGTQMIRDVIYRVKIVIIDKNNICNVRVW